jgi:hypothetical protein
MEAHTMFDELNNICTTYQRAYGFEIPSSAPILTTISIMKGTAYLHMYRIIGRAVNRSMEIDTGAYSGKLIPHLARLDSDGDCLVELYRMEDCVAYPQSKIEAGSTFSLALSNDVYNREVSSLHQFRALKSFTLEVEYLVWMGKMQTPFRFWLIDRGLASKLPTPQTFYHDPKTLELV